MNAAPPPMAEKTVSKSYVVPCATPFRDAVLDLCRRRNISVGDLARSVLILLGPEAVADWPDPGDPPPGDREEVVLKSGPSRNRRLRRKPRLQVRLPAGTDLVTIRRALALALATAKGERAVRLEDPNAPPPAPPPPPEPAIDPTLVQEAERLRHEVDHLREVVDSLMFAPLDQGVETREEALFVLGFPPRARPDSRAVKSRFRRMARIHHPDSGLGDHERMSQLNAALDVLRGIT